MEPRRTSTTAIAGAVCCREPRALAILAAVCLSTRESLTVNYIALSFIALTVVASLGVATWSWIAMNRVNEELRTFVGHENMHFES